MEIFLFFFFFSLQCRTFIEVSKQENVNSISFVRRSEEAFWIKTFFKSSPSKGNGFAFKLCSRKTFSFSSTLYTYVVNFWIVNLSFLSRLVFGVSIFCSFAFNKDRFKYFRTISFRTYSKRCIFYNKLCWVGVCSIRMFLLRFSFNE